MVMAESKVAPSLRASSSFHFFNIVASLLSPIEVDVVSKLVRGIHHLYGKTIVKRLSISVDMASWLHILLMSKGLTEINLLDLESRAFCCNVFLLLQI